MKILLKSVKINDHNSKHHLTNADVLIEHGIITQIGENIQAESDYNIIEANHYSISPSWIDMNMHIFEPGMEYRENYNTGLTAAAKAGYGAVCIMPNTNPVIDSKTQVDYVSKASHHFLTKTYPLGAISAQTSGKDLAEIYDMHNSGAVAFTDGDKPIQNAGLMERALLYVKKFNGLVFSNPYNENVAEKGQMNEGISSTVLGLHASPKLAEEIMVVRDLFLLEYTESRLHFMQISTKKSVELIRDAKAKGLRVTAGVNVANLYFDDSILSDYNTNYKVYPHLRNKEDVQALLEGLKDGTIDVINSGHKPLHEDEKKVEFENAIFGASTIDCSFSVARKATKNYLSEEELINKFTTAYQILNVSAPRIEEQQDAQITLYNLNKKYIFTKAMISSKGLNNPFIGEELDCEVLGLISKTKTNIL